MHSSTLSLALFLSVAASTAHGRAVRRAACSTSVTTEPSSTSAPSSTSVAISTTVGPTPETTEASSSSETAPATTTSVSSGGGSDSGSTVPYAAADNSVSYLPGTGWAAISATDAYDSTGQFLLSNANQGQITFTFPIASSSFTFYGWQRSGQGMYSLSIDGGDAVQVDYYNSTSTGSDPPLKLYSVDNLTNDVHTVVITNVADTRVNSTYGQMNVDHFELVGDATSTVSSTNPSTTSAPQPTGSGVPTFPAGSVIYEAPLEATYHVSIGTGANAVGNGGDNSTVKVLLDAGATGAWVIWSGCTQDVCNDNNHGHYTPSSDHFANTTESQDLVYGDGGPANTLTSWHVTDSVSFGSAFIASTDFGASYHLPGEEGLDGNFGVGRGYCGGTLCSTYPSFIENMYDQGIIAAPILSFYQLTDSDSHPASVSNVAQIGGLDRNKFVGNMDWAPLVQSSSQWQIDNAQRYATDANGNVVELTSQFAHSVLCLDTGDPGLLGLPSDDWQILVSSTGAKSDGNGGYRFPCTSQFTWNFHGSENRNYTFNLADTTTDDGTGFCNALANDAGDTTNWITGAPFLTTYYLSFYYGEHGNGGTVGFGVKNLDASAATNSPVVGSA